MVASSNDRSETQVPAGESASPAGAVSQADGDALPVQLNPRIFNRDIRPLPAGAFLAGVHSRLNELPLGTKGAVVAYADQDGGHFAVIARPDKRWTFEGYLDKPWDGRLTYGAQVVFAF